MRPYPLIVSLPMLVLATVASAGPAAASQSASAARGSRIVISPHRGQAVRSHHPRVRVRSRGTSGALEVRLNGVSLGKDFGRPHGGVRTLRVSISHCLRRGRNVLRVRVRRRDGSIRRATVRFFVRSKRPLVGAGRDRRVAVGSVAQLSGRIAPARRLGARPPAFAGAAGKGSGSGARPLVRWKVVRRPHRGSARAVTGARASAKARLASPAGLTAGFRPAVPGRYTLALTSGMGSNATSDRVTLTAVPPDPLVQIDTQAGTAAKPGIKIGSTLYPADTGKGAGAIQVVVLDRQTLGLESNASYTVDGAGIDSLKGAVGTLNKADLVVAAQPNPGNGWNAILDALAGIGAPLAASVEKTYRVSAVIGVPGMKRGDADAGMSRIGGLKGYLTPDQFLDYGFVAAGREPFSYPPDPQPPCRPGGAAPCDGRAGFQIHVRNEFTLEPQLHDGDFYNTNGRELTDAQRKAEADRMTHDINDIVSSYNGDSLVTIETVSSRSEGEASYRAPIGALNGDSMKNLAAAVASVGGTRDAFNRSTITGGSRESGGHVYTLVGWTGAGEGNGAEAAAGVNGTPDAPTLSGVLRPDRQSRFRPESVSTGGGDPDALANMVMRAPSDDWPLDGDPGARKAIAHLGSNVINLGPNPRLAYWTADWTQSTTNHLIDLLEHASYPGAGAGFTRADFDAASAELIKELGWVGTVRQYMHDLARPFTDNQLQSWTAAHNVADQIYEATREPDDKTTYRWLGFTKILLDLFDPFTEDVSGEIGSLMDLGMWIAGAT